MDGAAVDVFTGPEFGPLGGQPLLRGGHLARLVAWSSRRVPMRTSVSTYALRDVLGGRWRRGSHARHDLGRQPLLGHPLRNGRVVNHTGVLDDAHAGVAANPDDPRGHSFPRRGRHALAGRAIGIAPGGVCGVMRSKLRGGNERLRIHTGLLVTGDFGGGEGGAPGEESHAASHSATPPTTMAATVQQETTNTSCQGTSGPIHPERAASLIAWDAVLQAAIVPCATTMVE